jgi:regulator of sigma E protease
VGSPLLIEPVMVDTLLTSGSNAIIAIQAGFADYLPILLGETPFLESLVARVWNILQVALGLGFVIFVHELGHFLAAKTFGVRCDKFYVGFDVPISIGPIKFPRTLGKFQWGETEYGIGIIPLGGYVKMLGQDDDPRQAEAEAERVRAGGDGEQTPLDPRSYTAKKVWQRMIIISAGVVMNLIFAVILAAVAFWFGVPYTPTVVGGTYAGGPAWEAGLEAGDQIVGFDSMSEDDPKLRYQDFSTGVIIRGLDKQAAPMNMALLRDGQRVETTVTPTADYSDKEFYLIGVTAQLTPVIGAEPYAENSYVANAKPDLKAGDVITAVNGEELPVDKRFDEVLGTELTSRFQANWRDQVTLTIERPAPIVDRESPPAPSVLNVDIPAVPVKSLGIGFAVGPVTAIQKDSIAEKAGIRVGDIIEEINGTKVIDAFRLPDMAAQLAGQEVKLKLRRGEPTAEPKDDSKADSPSGASFETLEVSFEAPKQASFEPIAPVAGRLSLGGVGVAFDALPKISSVSTAVAEKAGFAVGDLLTQYQWSATKEEKNKHSKRFSNAAFEPQVLDEAINVAGLFEFLQLIPEGSQVKLSTQREGKTREATLPLANADDWFWHLRGVALTQLKQIHEADSVSDAAALGLWETKRRFSDVLNFLRLLVSGKIGASGLGGPLAIAQAASSEASNGVSRLLIFLTLLSANLAILNFLPIPALDGGHMLFLTAEAIRGKPINEALQVRLTMLGVLSLLGLMAFVIVNDILRWM